jgi:hypothetical protein
MRDEEADEYARSSDGVKRKVYLETSVVSYLTARTSSNRL